MAATASVAEQYSWSGLWKVGVRSDPAVTLEGAVVHFGAGAEVGGLLSDAA
jgi:hypothetical protein